MHVYGNLLEEESEDIKGLIRISKLKRNRQHNRQKKIKKGNKLSTKHTNKTNGSVRGTPLKSGFELQCSGRVSKFEVMTST